MQAVLRRKWWVPVLLLGMLLVKAWLVGNSVQGEAQALAADAAGIPIAQVEMVDGLNVRLTGFTDEVARDQAVLAVDALDATWEVEGLLVGEESGGVLTSEATNGADDTLGVAGSTSVTAAPAPTTTSAAPAASAEPAALSLVASSDGGVLVRGVVADESARDAILDSAGVAFGADNLTDELTVDAEAVSPTGGEVTLTGEAGSDGQKAEWLDGAAVIADAGGFTIVDDVTVVAVDDELNALFELEPIEFDYNAATIRPGSIPTLDEAASVINANPGVGPLRVVGHTDGDGPAASNQRLSQRRAEAVVAYLVESGGVGADRVSAEGRGEAELKIEPEISDDDKQRNRRIEWELTG